MSTVEQYKKQALDLANQMKAPLGSPAPEPAPQPVIVPVGEIPLRLLEFRRGHKTTELGVFGLVSVLLGVAALLAGLDLSTWAYCQTGIGVGFIHSRGMAKQRRR